MKPCALWPFVFGGLLLWGCGQVTATAPDARPGTIDATSTCQANADCTDNVFCNGEETCDPSSLSADDRGCVVAATPCDESETCDEESQACLTPCEVNPDEDGDGADAIACGGDDCDDSRAEINPGAREVCDPLDVDEDCNADTDGTEDIDDDDEVDYRCEFPDGMGGTTTGIDCDDSTPGYFLGDWAHCGTCGTSCGVRESCVEGACVPARRVFASSTGGTGNFGGVAGGDAFCQNLADAAALGGTWKAYLVDDSAGLERLEHASVPYIRLDGKLVAKNFTDLTDGSIAAPINVSEKRLSLTGIRWVGLGVGRNCQNWTSAADGCLSNSDACGDYGDPSHTDGKWFAAAAANCSGTFGLYCIEQ